MDSLLPKETPPAIIDFCRHVENITKKNAVLFTLSPDSHIPYPSTKDLVNGYMIELPQKELAVATKKPLELWLPVLVHESSHLDQMLEKSDYWYNSYVPGTTLETIDIITLWIEGKIELNEKQLNTYTTLSRDVELDCERRTVEKIKTFNLPIGIREYIQKANSYIFFYSAMKKTKAWYIPGKEPYNTKEVWSLCPTEFLADNEYEKVPENLMEQYQKILS